MGQQFRIIAGTDALYIIFEYIGAYHVGKGNGGQKENNPPKPLYLIILNDKNDDKKVKRCPHKRNAQEGHQYIKKRIGCASIDGSKQGLVPLLQLLQKTGI